MIERVYNIEDGEWRVRTDGGRVTTIDPHGTQLTTDLGFATAYKFSPDDCLHRNGYWMQEVDGSTYHCSDCGSMLDEDFEIVICGDCDTKF